jgi:hypothetical protein
VLFGQNVLLSSRRYFQLEKREEKMRSIVVRVSCTALVLAAMGAGAADLSYPSGPVRLIIPFSPGGAADVPGRILVNRLSESLGHQVVIETGPVPARRSAPKRPRRPRRTATRFS